MILRYKPTFHFLDFKLSPYFLYVVSFLLGNSLASEFYVLTFRNTLSHLHRQVSVEWSFYTNLPMKMEQTECCETSAYKIQMPGNYPEENLQPFTYSIL